jgi:hypothetical protein
MARRRLEVIVEADRFSAGCSYGATTQAGRLMLMLMKKNRKRDL